MKELNFPLNGDGIRIGIVACRFNDAITHQLLEGTLARLKKFEVKDGRIFTLHLRKGHRWSDGHPFTSEDFRYYFEDVATNNAIANESLPLVMLVEGKPPLFEVIDKSGLIVSASAKLLKATLPISSENLM